MIMDNPMRDVRINKVVINIGTGGDEKMQGNAKRLIETDNREEARRRDIQEKEPRIQDNKGPEDRRVRYAEG